MSYITCKRNFWTRHIKDESLLTWRHCFAGPPNNSMNGLEEIGAPVDSVNINYKYSASCCSYYGFALGYSGDCIAAAELIIDFAKELGYSGELVSTNYAVDTHRAARIYIGSTYYDVDVWAYVI